jgi:hypothetical protein
VSMQTQQQQQLLQDVKLSPTRVAASWMTASSSGYGNGNDIGNGNGNSNDNGNGNGNGTSSDSVVSKGRRKSDKSNLLTLSVLKQRDTLEQQQQHENQQQQQNHQQEAVQSHQQTQQIQQQQSEGEGVDVDLAGLRGSLHARFAYARQQV